MVQFLASVVRTWYGPHKCTQSDSDKFVGASWCNCWTWCFEILKSSVWSRGINFIASVWFAIHLILQMLRNFYLTNWKKEFYLTNQKMLRNIRSSKWIVARHSLHLKIDIQSIANFDLMSDLYALMESLIIVIKWRWWINIDRT